MLFTNPNAAVFVERHWERMDLVLSWMLQAGV